jgi:ATP-dependent Clp protease ATP-binding subunit ClpX
LRAIAKKSLERKSGARGLRAIMEETMLDVMYDIPSMDGLKECVINQEVILNKEEPILLFEQSQEQALSQEA